MDYQKYKSSRNAAWQILVDNQVNGLPVRVSKLCKDLGIDIYLYTPTEQDSDGKSIIIDDRPAILVSELCSVQRQRFTTAHELGHIILGHIGKYTLVNREPTSEDNLIEQQANVFAARLLAPAIVLKELNVQNAEQIAQICNISNQAAEFRWQRLQLLYKREEEHIKKYGRSCFGLHPLERQVLQQFADYIQKNKL